MKIVFSTFGVACLLVAVTAVHTRENSNVLVPNKDVNFQAKIKKFLNDEEVDREDFSENEIESLKMMKSRKVDKLLTKALEKENVVFDDVNRNIEENKIDRVEKEVTRERDLDDVRTSTTEGYLTTEPSYLTTESMYSTTNFSTPSIPMAITPTMPVTPSNSTVNDTTTETWTVPTVIPTTPNNTFGSTTPGTPEATTPNITTWETTTGEGWSSSPSPPTIQTNPTNPTTPNPPTAITTTFEPPSSTSDPIYDDLQTNECLLGSTERNLKWADSKGNLSLDFITKNFGSVRIANLAEFFLVNDYEDFVRSSRLFHVSFTSNFTTMFANEVSIINFAFYRVRILINST
jgi:hypothetical protein